MARKEKRVEEECPEKLDLEDSRDQLDPRDGREDREPLVTLAVRDLWD